MRSSCQRILTIVLLTAASTCFGQFHAVLNIPPYAFNSAPSLLESFTQANIYEGGDIGSLWLGLRESESIEVNLFGGSVAGITAQSGATTNVEGGHLGTIDLRAGSALNFRSGYLGGLQAEEGSQISLAASHVNFNGEPVAGLSSAGDRVEQSFGEGWLTGFTSDGNLLLFRTDPINSPIGFEFVHADLPEPKSIVWPDVPTSALYASQRFTLANAVLPEHFGEVWVVGGEIVADSSLGLSAKLWNNASLIATDNSLAYVSAYDSYIDIENGSFKSVDAARSTVHFRGTVTNDAEDLLEFTDSIIEIHDDASIAIADFGGASTVHMHGGDLRDFSLSSESALHLGAGFISGWVEVAGELNLHGQGYLTGDLIMESGSKANISGGQINAWIALQDDAQLEISGGQIRGVGGGNGVLAFYSRNAPARVSLFGSDFRLDGNAVESVLDVRNIASGELTGTLLDGSSLSLSIENFDQRPGFITFSVPEPRSVWPSLVVSTLCVMRSHRRRTRIGAPQV